MAWVGGWGFGLGGAGRGAGHAVRGRLDRRPAPDLPRPGCPCVLGHSFQLGTFLPRRPGGKAQTGREVPKWRKSWLRVRGRGVIAPVWEKSDAAYRPKTPKTERSSPSKRRLRPDLPEPVAATPALHPGQDGGGSSSGPAWRRFLKVLTSSRIVATTAQATANRMRGREVPGNAKTTASTYSSPIWGQDGSRYFQRLRSSPMPAV